MENKKIIEGKGFGSVGGVTAVKNFNKLVTLNNVLYVPHLISNLISISKAKRIDYWVFIDNDIVDCGGRKI